MNANANSQALVQATMNLVAAYVGKSDELMGPDRIVQLMNQFHQAAVGLTQSTTTLPAVSRLDDAFPQQMLPTPEVQAVPDMPAEARGFLSDSIAYVGGEMAEAGAHLDDLIWQGVPEESRAKFRRLIDEHNMMIGPNGYPVPRRPVKRLISEDRMQVADPITGDYHTMLKRHLRVAHDLDHEELLAMFGYTEQQLPRSGPRYSEAKAIQARRTGLGKNKRAIAVAEAPQAITDQSQTSQGRGSSRKRERASA